MCDNEKLPELKPGEKLELLSATPEGVTDYWCEQEKTKREAFRTIGTIYGWTAFVVAVVAVALVWPH